MSGESVSRDPFVGPRPFERDDAEFFFGRAGEVQELFSSVFANRVVVLYAASGAGKTSLLNAGVVPLLEQAEHFDVLPTVRLRRLAPEELEARSIENVFVYTSLLNWTTDGSPPHATLETFLASLPRGHDARGRPLPRAILFDQFEELFTVYPEHWEQREGFFEQLAEAVDADPHLRVVLALREDYLAQLDPLLPVLPFYVLFRLEQLGRDAAVEAVTKPVARRGRRFKPGVAERLVDDLLTLRVDIGTGEPITAPGEFVEPVQLQVTCQSLWTELPADAEVITDEHLHAFGDVDEVLRRFYDEVVHAAVVTARIREGRLRQSIEDAFITSVGTRSTVYRTAATTGEIPNAAIDELEDRHLVRAEWRAGARWYELTHDRLIDPVESSNVRYRSRISKRRRKRAMIGVAALTVLVGILGAVLGTLLPRSPSGKISISSLDLGVPYRVDYGLRLRPPDLVTSESRGTRFSVQVKTHRYSGRPLVLLAEIVDAAKRRPLGAPALVQTFSPPSNDVTVPIKVWIPIPTKRGRFFYRFNLFDLRSEHRLDVVDSKPFAASAGGLAAVPLGGSFSRLSVMRRGSGGGTIISTPDGIDCGNACQAQFPRGVRVVLDAVSAPGSRFVAWGGSCGAAGECAIKVAGAVSVSGTFEQIRLTHVLGRSAKGREIRAVEIGDPRARRKVLVVGCVHGDECAGIAIANRLAQESPVAGADLWIVPNLNPDGFAASTRQNAHGVDLNRNFPWRWRQATATPGSEDYRGRARLSEPESKIVQRLITRLKPAVTIWYYARKHSQPPPAVGEVAGRIEVARRYEQLVGLGHVAGDNPGSATNWQNATFPNSQAFFVELPFGSLGPAIVKRHADAVLAIAKG